MNKKEREKTSKVLWMSGIFCLITCFLITASIAIHYIIKGEGWNAIPFAIFIGVTGYAVWSLSRFGKVPKKTK